MKPDAPLVVIDGAAVNGGPVNSHSPPRATLTATQMREALYRHFVGQFAVLFEIAADARQELDGNPASPIPLLRSRQIDALMIRKARKQGIGPLDLLAVEIKVSRSDFLADIREPAKQAPWREIAHRHAYACPEGLVRTEEIPEGSGFLTVGPPRNCFVEWARRAPYTDTPPVPAWLTLTFAGRAAAAEAKTRGISWDTRGFAGESPEDLGVMLAKARADLRSLNDRLVRAQAEIREWKTVFAAQGHLPCAHCGQPVRPKSVRQGQFTGWRHVAAAHEEPCEQIRRAVSRWAEVEPSDGNPVPLETL